MMKNQTVIRNEKVKNIILEYRESYGKSDKRTRKKMDRICPGTFSALMAVGGLSSCFTWLSLTHYFLHGVMGAFFIIWIIWTTIMLTLWKFGGFYWLDKKLLFAREIGKGKIMNFHFLFAIIHPALLFVILEFLCFFALDCGGGDDFKKIYFGFNLAGIVIVSTGITISLAYFCEDVWLKNKDNEFIFSGAEPAEKL